MSNKIQILSESLANKIAAGEVVQRPESAVKELIENAIDAEATMIEVMIKRAGKVLIQVCDDGVGMSEDDVVVSIQKHATSKISTYEDLEAIKTLGFRGEALSSMAAVSQLEIRTEQKEDEIGTLLELMRMECSLKKKVHLLKEHVYLLKIFFTIPRLDETFLKQMRQNLNISSIHSTKLHWEIPKFILSFIMMMI